MMKLLNEQDRAAVRAGTLDGWLTTQSDVGSLYRCGACANFTACSADGCEGTLMPCSLSPKNPLKHFVPATQSAYSDAIVAQMQGTPLDVKLHALATLTGLVNQAVDWKAQRAKYPYAVGDTVKVIWDGTLKDALVRAVDDAGVSVQVGENIETFQHRAVIPPRA